MFLVFYRTTDVFEAEERLQNININTEIVPTPVQDKAYCGVCVKINEDEYENIKKIIEDLDYKPIY